MNAARIIPIKSGGPLDVSLGLISTPLSCMKGGFGFFWAWSAFVAFRQISGWLERVVSGDLLAQAGGSWPSCRIWGEGQKSDSDFAPKGLGSAL